jgi:hypothetical protein
MLLISVQEPRASRTQCALAPALFSLGKRALCRRRRNLGLRRHLHKLVAAGHLPGEILRVSNPSRDFENETGQTKDNGKSAPEKIDLLPPIGIACRIP